MFRFFGLFKHGNKTSRGDRDSKAFRKKYAHFKKILVSNDQALEIIADLEQTFYQDKPFTFGYALSQAELLVGEALTMVESLNALCGHRFRDLSAACDRIGAKIFSDLERKKKLEEDSLVLPLERLSLDSAGEVGGKAANLGEVFNRVHLPVPRGFAITAYACQHFMEKNRLNEIIDDKMRGLDVDNTERLVEVSHEVKALIRNAEVPADLGKAISRGVSDLKSRLGPLVRLAVRSSATSEDSEASFAGQHSSVLNVSEANVHSAYKEVVSSTFNPRAIFYRRKRGYMDRDVIMGVACVAMIAPRVSGVMYTVDPNDSRHAVILISAVWGLAVSAVDGSCTTDFFQIDKKSRKVEVSEIHTKKTLFRSGSSDGLVEEAVPEGSYDTSCLDAEQIGALVECALRLEKHYGIALDIEWAIDHNNHLYIIQARPLKRVAFRTADQPTATQGESDASLCGDAILSGGTTASEGSAAGRAYVIKSDQPLHRVPEGAILVARQTSPVYVPIMGRVRAIVTDVGSVTGHMAAVAREFRIPTLVGTGSATQVIPDGKEITVDANGTTVYMGRVEALLKEKIPVNPMKGSPIYLAVQSALKHIAPLNLTDPKRDDFRPDACRTIHDITRFCHEMAMQEMFHMTDNAQPGEHVAIPLDVGLPLNVYVVDLGGGLAISDKTHAAKNDVVSIPLLALLKGMGHTGVDWAHDPGVDMGGFFSILAESVWRDPLREGRMGGPNYAVISKEYLNFNAHLGYHFATVDTYCGEVVNDNYITFFFKGGAADIGRRTRRARLISLILSKLDFRVDQKGDIVRGELKKYDSLALEDKLDQIGRLLGSVRLLDMVLADDGQVDWYADEFFKGNYTFQQHIE